MILYYDRELLLIAKVNLIKWDILFAGDYFILSSALMFELERLSTKIGWYPASMSATTISKPIYPVPLVTRTFLCRTFF